MRRPSPLVMVLCILFFDMLCQGMAYPSMPSLIQKLGGLTPAEAARLYGWLIASYAIAELIGAPTLGILSDRFGRKPILVLSCISASVSFLISATAQSVPVLFVGYTLAGLTSAMTVVGNATIADISAPEDRATNYGRVGAVFGIGFVVGPAAGSLLAPLGLRAAFFAASGVMAVAAVLALVFMTETRKSTKESAFSWQEVLPWEGIRALARYPLPKKLSLSVALNALSLQMLIAVWVPYCSLRYGFGVAENGWLLAGFGIVMAIGQAVVVPWLVPKLGLRRSLAVGLTISILCQTGYGLSETWQWLLFFTAISALGGIDEPAMQAILVDPISEEERGAVQGGLASVNSLMGIVGPVLGATLFATFTGLGAPVYLPGAPFLFGAVCIALGFAWSFWSLRSTISK